VVVVGAGAVFMVVVVVGVGDFVVVVVVGDLVVVVVDVPAGFASTTGDHLPQVSEPLPLTWPGDLSSKNQ
jgi:hypothetical protein